jgi:ubiquinone/menaquinone biosynthesis C-methylase UbiE
LQLAFGFQVSKALYVLAKLGIPDLIAAGVSTSSELAARTGTVPDRLHRVLRTLSGFGIVNGAEDDVWSLTTLGETLRSDVPGSVRQMTIMSNEETYDAFSRLLDAVRSERPAFDLVFNTDFFGHLATHPESQATFNAAMGNLVRQSHAAAVATYDFGRIRSLVDVGGGSGALAVSILERYPELTATVFDLPQVVEEARTVIEAAGLADRATIAAGDFFEAVPAGAEAYILSAVLHDWDDDEATAILRTVRRAIPNNGRLLLVEFVLPSGDEPHLSKLLDLTMLGVLKGRERSENEFADLFARSGFKLERVFKTPAPVSVVDAVPT